MSESYCINHETALFFQAAEIDKTMNVTETDADTPIWTTAIDPELAAENQQKINLIKYHARGNDEFKAPRHEQNRQ
jgi:hypothetical protein